AVPAGPVTVLVSASVGALGVLTAAARLWTVVVVVGRAVVVVVARATGVVVGAGAGSAVGSAGAAPATAEVASQATRASRHATRARRPRLVGITEVFSGLRRGRTGGRSVPAAARGRPSM